MSLHLGHSMISETKGSSSIVPHSLQNSEQSISIILLIL